MRILITGGAGFIGCNAAARYIKRGDEVIVLDNLSRNGTGRNLAWLKKQGDFQFEKADICDSAVLLEVLSAVKPVDVVLHLAAQTAVTTSIINPESDFKINAEGTLRLLEAIRLEKQNPVFIYASTNKVYGAFEDVKLVEENRRYRYADGREGISEIQLLDFYSPYGCSKGCADQYVRDYARIYNMMTVVLRQSCIYGPHQFGVVDQGWVAWFAIAILSRQPISIYGDGKQVRDVLYIHDLLDCFDKVVENIDIAKGEVYNIGGGSANQVSVLELLDMLGSGEGKVDYRFYDERPGDQKVYVSDIRKAFVDLHWSPKIPLKDGLILLTSWIKGEETT